MLPDKKVCRLCFFFFFFATSFISISFLKPHLASWSSTSLQDPSEKRKKTHRRQGWGQFDQDIYNFISPFSVITSSTVFFGFVFCFVFSVCEDEVGKVRLQPVPGNHLTEFWRAVVWEFKVRAQAALTERVQVLIHKRQGEVS